MVIIPARSYGWTHMDRRWEKKRSSRGVEALISPFLRMAVFRVY